MDRTWRSAAAAVGATLVLAAGLVFESHRDYIEAKSAAVTGKTYTLTAMAGTQELAPGVTLPVWTFNGTVPGPEIRVRQGDTVTVKLYNELPEPVTIHWHGYPVPNAMDGVPGVTQNAVMPGESFTYTFRATVPGTYWYHSHQDSANQVDRGLYGAFIVEPRHGNDVHRDYTLMLDEWMSHPHGAAGRAMHHGAAHADGGGHDMGMYDLFTINGKSGPLTDELPVKRGDKVRLRLINAGNLTHRIHLQGHAFKVTAADGQPIRHPVLLKDKLVEIAPGERYDLEFTADRHGRWLVEDHGDTEAVKGMKAVIVYEGADGEPDRDEREGLETADLFQYGQTREAYFTLDQPYDAEFTLHLNTETKNGRTVYTINGRTHPNVEPLDIKKGDAVKVRLVNHSETDEHPMHLHGHFFQVLSRNGKPLTGAPVMKDTLNLKPGEEYVVAFRADNEGRWMFHCHELHHAAAGMMADVKYQSS